MQSLTTGFQMIDRITSERSSSKCFSAPQWDRVRPYWETGKGYLWDRVLNSCRNLDNFTWVKHGWWSHLHISWGNNFFFYTGFLLHHRLCWWITNELFHEALVLLVEGARLDLWLLKTLILSRLLPFAEVLNLYHGDRIEKMKCVADPHRIKVSEVFALCILCITIVRFGVRREFSHNWDCQGLSLNTSAWPVSKAYLISPQKFHIIFLLFFFPCNTKHKTAFNLLFQV